MDFDCTGVPPDLMPKAVAWAQTRSAEIGISGWPLDAVESTWARRVGVAKTCAFTTGAVGGNRRGITRSPHRVAVSPSMSIVIRSSVSAFPVGCGTMGTGRWSRPRTMYPVERGRRNEMAVIPGLARLAAMPLLGSTRTVSDGAWGTCSSLGAVFEGKVSAWRKRRLRPERPPSRRAWPDKVGSPLAGNRRMLTEPFAKT